MAVAGRMAEAWLEGHLAGCEGEAWLEGHLAGCEGEAGLAGREAGREVWAGGLTEGATETAVPAGGGRCREADRLGSRPPV